MRTGIMLVGALICAKLEAFPQHGSIGEDPDHV